MGFHHAERCTLAEVIGFAACIVFVGLDVNDMGMIVSLTGVISGAVAVIIGADNIIPVSYTHLDVYKRQIWAWIPGRWTRQ